MSNDIQIQLNPVINGTVEHLPASKSISNRVLILNALSGGKSTLHNLSDANDTHLMLNLVNSNDEIIDIEDAGTTMRFLTAYFAITGQHKIMTGTSRMQERPIGILVNALRTLGANITYEKKDGYPPLKLGGFSDSQVNSISIRGDVSSQFISAIMMVAPVLSRALTIELTGKIGSRPYIEMTASLMGKFGASYSLSGNSIHITPKAYQPCDFTVESDWSGASYWFAFVALAKEANIKLPRLFKDSLQGDQAIKDIMITLGVKSSMDNGFLHLTKCDHGSSISWDFTHCPDLAQTVAVVCAAKGIKGNFTGLESLRIKETDRIAALQNELQKIGADLIEEGSQWTLVPSTSLPSSCYFKTYKDHRMAMAFAPLASLMEVTIENPQVVKKSYPKYWDDLEKIGFTLSR